MFGPGIYSRKKFIITIKNHTLIPTAGIDESNANGYYILWPKKTNALLKEIHEYLIRKFKLKKLGVIATDSHSIPLRRGTIGISIGFYGFYPQYDYRGKPDIFGRKLKYTLTNIVDSVAAICVHLMGEGDEQVPMVIARGVDVVFTKKSTQRRLLVSIDKDMYYPLLKVFKKR
jgi:F420-0:gamma-glutamyl ligase